MSSGFVSETEIAEQRRRRQEEWEKVRTADQPLEAPEEVYDPRSLFERLEEQRKKKDEEFEEAHKLKNMVRGLDDDEVEFLDTVERLKESVDKKVRDEERAEMEQFRSAVATLAEQSLVQRLQQEIKPAIQPISKKPAQNRSSQQKLLAGAVIRKKTADTDQPPPKKMRTDVDAAPPMEAKQTPTPEDTKTDSAHPRNENIGVAAELAESGDSSVKAVGVLPSALQCVAVLPGLGSYEDSSDSELSSDSDAEPVSERRYDLVGRVIEEHVSEGAGQKGAK